MNTSISEVITSLAFTVALRIPGMKPHSAPADARAEDA